MPQGPLTPSQPTRKRQQTREHLIDAAIRVFAAEQDLTPPVDAFARAAGVSRGTYYNHFPDRSELRVLTVARVLAFVAREVRPLITPGEDPARELALLLRGILDLCTANPAWGLALTQLGPAAFATLRQHDPTGIAATLERGERVQRFDYRSREAVLDLIDGCLVAALTSVLHQQQPHAHHDDVLALVLHALGIAYAEADAIIAGLPNLQLAARWFNA